jgi:hypothetical protein
MTENDVSTPTMERCVTSYPVRRRYRPGVVHPPEVSTVKDTIDIHCHAHEGQQDALALAKYASECGMAGILFKTIAGMSNEGPTVRHIENDLAEWAAKSGITPVRCWAGHLLGASGDAPTVGEAVESIDGGVMALWLPVFNHANTYATVGGRNIWWDKDADPDAHSEPLPWDQALDLGHYLLDGNGALKPEIIDILKIIADRDVALFFGHATHKEIFLIAEEVVRLGIRRAVIDHPYSPFVNLSVAQMKELTAAGILFNFTFDELSPLLGVDPAKMYAAIREVGVENFTLSSDAGEPLFPNSVEAMRLIRAYMDAFGLSADELYRVCTVNPARVVGEPDLALRTEATAIVS